MVQQTPDIVRGIYDAASGTVRGYLQPSAYDRRILNINFTDGPTGSVFTLYRGYIPDTGTVMTTTNLGDRNSYNATQDLGSMVLYANEAATLEWAPLGGAFTGTETATAAVRSQWGVF